jgi:hypothetical protein
MGPAPAAGNEDYDLINAGKQPVTLLPGGAYFHHADSFAMMRGGHLMTHAFICDAIRTPFGRYGGACRRCAPTTWAPSRSRR